MAFTAQIVWVSVARDMPSLIEEMELMGLGENPYQAILQAALLKFRPINLDVLPLYIVLLLLFPPILWLLIRNATLALVASVGLYALTWEFGWNLPSYPSGQWWFNPFAWQLLFVFGAWCALGGAERLATVLKSPVTLWIAISYVVFAFGIVLTWHIPRLAFLVPRWLTEWMYPIDKTNLDVLRFAHFLALAAISIPTFITGPLFIAVFGLWLGWLIIIYAILERMTGRTVRVELLVREAGALEKAFAMYPEYLKDVMGRQGEIDLFNRSLELTRRARTGPT